MKICLLPRLDQVSPSNGIGRVVAAQYRDLPKFGFEFVMEPNDADLCIGHTQRFYMPRIDVLHLHGAYWSGDLNSGEYGEFNARANASIIESARLAHTITVPSRWVAMPFKRDMRINPVVIGHGIDFQDWQPAESSGYLLWNKNRVLDVCRPDAPYEMAKRGLPVASTYAPAGVRLPDSLMVIGRQDADVMRDYIRQADIYLSTTKETFGIGTLEAMACGVPVVGWNYGGTADIVTNGHDGILVKPGDYDALYDAVREAQSRRVELGRNARETASHYDWSRVIPQYAALYDSVLNSIQGLSHGVSVIVTTHNYARYVCEAVDSVLAQTRKADEIIVVDDGSTDDTLDRLARYRDAGVKVVTQENQGVAAARTTGIAASTQPYLVCLDADDKLAPAFIETLLPYLDGRRDLGIVYSGITLFNENEFWPSPFPPEFNWESQAAPHNPPSNCIPSACMFRKEMWFRAGPHKQEYAPGEDAEFWTRGLGTGYTALRVSEAGLFWYRMHNQSASRKLAYCAIDDRLPWMRDKRYPLAAPARTTPLIRSYSEPKVSVIIPVGPGHTEYVPDAIDSLLGQTMREWEAIIVDDSGEGGGDYLMARYPFIRYVANQGERAGVAQARNAGLEQARAPLVLFLDADDMLEKSALEEMLLAHIESSGKYVYPDVVKLARDKSITTLVAADYEQRVWKADGLHSITVLIPTDWARAIGFDPSLPTWEEGDFYTRMAIAGYCGHHLKRPLLIWRDWTGERHTATKAQKAKALRHQKKFEGQAMASCCGGNGADSILEAKAAIAGMTLAPKPANNGQQVRMEFVGERFGPITFFGGKGREYRGGRETENKFTDVFAEDVTRLEQSGQWRVAV